MLRTIPLYLSDFDVFWSVEVPGQPMQNQNMNIDA